MARPKQTKRARVPRRPYDKDRLIDEMKLLGEFGLKNKTELWTIEHSCDTIKRRAKDLLITVDENEQIVHGRTLLSKLVKLGIIADVDFKDIEDIRRNLERVLDLTASKFLERRLQHRLFEAGLAKSVHHARNLINHRHVSVKGQIVNKPGFMVTVENEGFIEIAKNSSLNGVKLGRNKKKAARAS
jgi:small subunit ribosomal protein S9e